MQGTRCRHVTQAGGDQRASGPVFDGARARGGDNRRQAGRHPRKASFSGGEQGASLERTRPRGRPSAHCTPTPGDSDWRVVLLGLWLRGLPVQSRLVALPNQALRERLESLRDGFRYPEATLVQAADLAPGSPKRSPSSDLASFGSAAVETRTTVFRGRHAGPPAVVVLGDVSAPPGQTDHQTKNGASATPRGTATVRTSATTLARRVENHSTSSALLPLAHARVPLPKASRHGEPM